MVENSSQPGLDALLNNVAFAPIHNVGWICVTGEDRVRWLNGMVTNSITALKPCEGCYNFFLNAQGRIQGDCTAWLETDAILLQTAAARVDSLIAYLDRFIIMDDVELHALPSMVGFQYIGPRAAALLAESDLPVPAPLQRLTATLRLAATWDPSLPHMLPHILHAHSPLVPRFELWADAGKLGMPRRTPRDDGIPEPSPEALEALRILEGTPLFGIDIRDKDLPQETNQARALHFSKGCYLGQEIVERIRSRGAVHRTFHGFVLKGDEAEPGTTLFTTDPAKPIGELTSVARIGSLTLALGYIRREALETKALISYTGGTAEPTSLPYLHPIS